MDQYYPSMAKRKSLQQEIDALSPNRTLHEYQEAALTAIDFEKYSRLVSSLLNAEVGAVTFHNGASQYRLGETNKRGLSVVPDCIDKRETICQYTIKQDTKALVISDLSLDERFQRLDCVTSGPKFRTYAGFPIKVREGFNIGAVCAIDAMSRNWTETEIGVLQDLSSMITNDLNLHFQTQSVLLHRKMQSSVVEFIRANSQVGDQTYGRGEITRICQNASKILRATLDVQALCLMRLVSRKQHSRLGVETEIVGADGFAGLAQKNFTFRSDEICSAFRADNAYAVYDRNTVPVELLQMLGDDLYGVIISSWPSTEYHPGGLILAKSTDSQRTFRSIEKNYLQAFGSTLMRELQKEKIAEANRVKTEFISSLSHELRTPLHGLLHNADVLLETQLDSEQVELIQDIATCGHAQLDIVESMLDLRTAKGRKSLFTSIDLSDHVDVLELVEDVITKAVERHERRPQAYSGVGNLQPAEQVEVVVDCPLSVNDNNLRQRLTHRKTLQKILSHLVANSLKWTQTGYVKVEVNLSEASAQINVCDTGVGIEADFLRNKLFQSFSKEDSFTSGLGLGLSVVGDLVSQLGGSIAIDSEKGAFTNVRLVLPMSVSQTAPAPALDIRQDLTVAIKCSDEPLGRGERLLVDTIERDLLSLGCSISRATSDTTSSLPAILIVTDKTYVADTHHTLPTIYTRRKTKRAYWQESRRIEAFIGPCYGLSKLSKVLTQMSSLGAGLTTPRQPVNSAVPEQGRKRTHSPERMRDSDARARKVPNQLDVQQAVHESVFDDAALTSTTPSTPDHRYTDKTVFQSPSNSSRDTQDSPMPEASATPRVLIVEDNPLNSRLLVRYMEKCSYDFRAVTNGQEAVDAVKLVQDKQEPPYDVVLMDIQMPVLDGLKATEHIRQLETTTQAPQSFIVACTGLSAADDKRKAAQVGCNQFLTKPISLTTLRQVFEDWKLNKP